MVSTIQCVKVRNDQKYQHVHVWRNISFAVREISPLAKQISLYFPNFFLQTHVDSNNFDINSNTKYQYRKWNIIVILNSEI